MEAIYQAIIHGQPQAAKECDMQSIENCRKWIGSHYKPDDRFHTP